MPLLRLDFGALYNKYHGETERNLRESLHTAEVMSPCVLWLDEIEKGLATGHDESGTARRVLGGLLTWMAERKRRVFLVATANDVDELPPELMRKGRFDEIFFVDLPPPAEPRRDSARFIYGSEGLRRQDADLAAARRRYGRVLRRRDRARDRLCALRGACARASSPISRHLLAEFRKTRPLSVVMAERVAALRDWAHGEPFRPNKTQAGSAKPAYRRGIKG